MLDWLMIYGAVIGTILIADIIWLGLIAKTFYANQLGELMLDNFKVVPAMAFYLLFAVGLVILAVRPGDSTVSLGQSAFYGGVAGFIAYGTYNMTNYATLKRWPLKMTWVDWPWGTGLSALAAFAGAYVKLHYL